MGCINFFVLTATGLKSMSIVKMARQTWSKIKTNPNQWTPLYLLFNFGCGRATTFAIVFTVTGIILAFKGKLDANYSLFVGAVQTLVFAHSVKEDWNQQKQSAQATVNVINEVSGPAAQAATPPQPIALTEPKS
jgi:hypothetical protein